MKDKILKRARIIVGVVLIILIVGLFIIKPRIIFNGNEKEMKAAAERYFELNSNELPSGERVKTLKLQKLYDAGILKNDFYRPLSKKTCSNENSWVKVRKENGEYKYYAYLECGYLKSNVDHEGPIITLNGDTEMIINRGSEYKEPGVKSVVDKKDGKFKNSDVTIKGNVDTSKRGTYEVTYTAFDKLSNKTEVTRTVKVVRKIYETVKDALGDETNFKGNPIYNYVRLSNMIFRIYGYDAEGNVILVSYGDIANVNYSKLDEWLEYYYDNLNDMTKKMLVEKKYCSMTLNDGNLNKTKCEKYTENKKIYIPSVVEVNNAATANENFMKPTTMSWVADKKNAKEAYLTRDTFYGEEQGKDYLAYSVTDNFGVRPMFTIKGDTLIKSGNGSFESPYSFGDNKRARGGSPVNERQCGEYIEIDEELFRVSKVEKDGTVRIISDSTIGEVDNLVIKANSTSDTITYNPKNKSSIAYTINNQAVEYLDTSNFEKHSITAPIYKGKIIYGKEIENKEYKVLLSAPNMYEMFAAQSTSPDSGGSYWLINTSRATRTAGAIEEVGVPMNEEISRYENFGIRVVAYLKKDTVITSGEGTIDSPYRIK